MFRSKITTLLVALVIVGIAVFGVGFGALTVVGLSTMHNASAAGTLQGLQGPSPVQAAQPGAPSVQSPVAPAPVPVTVNIPSGADPESAIFEAVYQKVNPSVVQIVNMATDPNLNTSQAIPQGEGSGFVWDKQGDIVTNAHVVDGADKLQVIFADGTTLDAKLLGADPSGDLAVIRVDPTQVNLTPIEQGNISQVKVGQRVIAIGNPFGFSGTMTQGIVSALGRSIPSLTNFDIPEAIQTDAAINPGNSGGPLLNEQGQVIGVNDQIQSSSGSSSGVGFAIPINIVQRIVPALIKTGQYLHPYLGIEGGTYTQAWAQALGFPQGAKGAYVLSVTRGGPAAQAGLRAGSQNTDIILGVDNFGSPPYLQRGGDLITAVDAHSIANMDDLLVYLEENTTAGQTVHLTVLQAGGNQRTVSVTLGQRPNQTQSSQSLP